MNQTKYLLLFTLIILINPTGSFAKNSLGFEPPLASEARTSPAKTEKELIAEKDEANRVRFSVMIGSHQFDNLEKSADAIIKQYESKQISADDFIAQLYTLVPNKSGKAHIPDMMQWTKQYPKSYAAWYVLGRQYLNIAKEARGGAWSNETPREQLEEMDKYARLAHDALVESLKYYKKPLPSYRTLIEAVHFIGNNKANEDYDYLQAAIKADPDSSLIYNLYFTYNVPRWGGSFEQLQAVLDQAKKTAISNKNLIETEAYFYELEGDEAKDRMNDLSLASALYIKAFEKNPAKDKLYRFYTAASHARKAHKIDLVIEIYTKIIKVDPTDHQTYFERGVILREENRDLKQHFLDQIASAKLGNKYAQNNIGYYYLTGDKGFPVNLQQAKAWLQLSANQGFDHAKQKLLVVEEELKKSAR